MSKMRLDPNEMSFLDHLEDLRWHILRSFIAIFIVGIGAFIFKDFIFDKIIFGPKDINFPTYKILCTISNFIGLDDSFCITELPFRVQSRTVSGQFSAHIWTSIAAGFVIAFPYVLYQFWSFISPGLYQNEKKYARGFIFVSSLLFFIGVVFGYYVICPLSINFLGNYSVSNEVFNDFDLNSYIGLVNPEILIKYRKFALVGVLILAAVITPPDVASQIIVAIPIVILYQISIYISRIVTKNNK